MLEIKDLTVRYGEGRNALTAVRRFSLSIPTGTTVGLVGESGCGKSTVARALVGLVRAAEGSIRLDGEDVSSHQARDSRLFRRRVQMVFQDPYSSLNPRMRVGEMLDEAVALESGESRKRRRDRVVQLLEMVGLSRSMLERYPHQFSGGQRQRVAIARTLAIRPSLIINDEVTSALDVSVQAAILNLLRELQRELQLTYLFISHDLSVIRYMSDVVAVMYLREVVGLAPTDRLFASPAHPYSQALMASAPRVGKRRRGAPLSGDVPDPLSPPPGCPFHQRCPIGPLRDPSRTICRERDPQDVASEKPNRAACFFAEEASSAVPSSDGPAGAIAYS